MTMSSSDQVIGRKLVRPVETVWSNSYTPPHFGRGRLQTEAVVRRRASKTVLRSPGATQAIPHSQPVAVWYGLLYAYGRNMVYKNTY
jgi:hypothetical protein